MSVTATALRQQSLSKLRATDKANLIDSLQKMDYIAGFNPPNGLVVLQYPSGAPMTNIKKVCKCVEKVTNFTSFEMEVVADVRDGSFVLVRNNSKTYSNLERIKKETGGTNSPDVAGLGCFQIVEVVYDRIIRQDYFFLYKISDNVNIDY